jgi:tetratricopeptide (TPR) repeat protein
MYFNIGENDDLSYEIGGLLYDLGMYSDALDFFQFSLDIYGDKADVFYNQALCFYQLRKDKLFYSSLEKLKILEPNSNLVQSLEGFDMG